MDDHVTLKTGVMMLEIHSNQLHFTIVKYTLLLFLLKFFKQINPALVSMRGYKL